MKREFRTNVYFHVSIAPSYVQLVYLQVHVQKTLRNITVLNPSHCWFGLQMCIHASADAQKGINYLLWSFVNPLPRSQGL
jgi:hypothetical protein